MAVVTSNWIGGAKGSNNWYEAKNWSNGVPQGVLDTAIFDGANIQMGRADDVVVDKNVKIGTLLIRSNYSGTINARNDVYPVANFQMDGGQIAGLGRLTFARNSVWSGGTITDIAGQKEMSLVLLPAGSKLSIEGNKDKVLDHRRFENDGIVTWTGSGNILCNDQVLFVNGPNAAFSINTHAALTARDPSQNKLSFENNGIIFAQSDNKTVSVIVTNHFVSRGGIVLRGPGLQLNSDDGTLFKLVDLGLANTKLLLFANWTFSGTTFSNSGLVDTAKASDVTISGNVTIPNLDQGGDLNGSGLLTVKKSYEWSGGAISGFGRTDIQGTMEIDGGSELLERYIANHGTITLKTPQLEMSKGAVIENRGTFNLDESEDPSAIEGRNAAILNWGTFQFAYSGNRSTSIAPTFSNYGKIIDRTGTMTFSSLTQYTNFTFLDNSHIAIPNGEFILKGGVISGIGTVDAVVGVAELDPGGINSVGILTINREYVQTDSQDVVNIDIGGTGSSSYDHIGVNGPATLQGTLNLNVLPGYTPQVGDTFQIMTFASLQGTFKTITGCCNLPGSTHCAITYNPTNITVTVVSNSISQPTLTGISPTTGPTPGGTVVTITGTNFADIDTVLFGGVPVEQFTVNSTTQITATSPPHALGLVDVTVANCAGTSSTSSADQFTYTLALPTVTGVSPSSGFTTGGPTVTVTGTNFGGATSVSFGAVPASSFEVTSNTSITAIAPAASAGTVDITVTTFGGTSSAVPADQFTYTTASAPAVTSISPTSGSSAGGTSVTVTGSAFTTATDVFFGLTPATSFTVNSDSSITAVAPPNAAGTWDITVTSPYGTSALAAGDQFTSTQAAAPALSSISTTTGTTEGGTVVTLTGTALLGTSSVLFGLVPAPSFTVNSDTSVTVTSPPQVAGAVNISVTTPSGNSPSVAASQFTYTAAAAPTITALDTPSGSTGGGTVVTLTGTTLLSTTAVNFGTVPAASFTINSATSLTALAPPQAAGTVNVTVTTATGTSASSTANQFVYLAAPAPAVTALSSSSGTSLGGATVMITGTNLNGASAISFGTTPATWFTSVSNTGLMALAPPLAAGTYDITVTTPSGTSSTSSADQFTVTTAAAPAITGISPSSSGTGGGTVVSLTGSGFTGATDVSFGGNPAASFTVFSDTLLTAVAPPHAAGTWDLSVTSPAGTSALASADRFTYTAAAAPAVTALGTSGGGTLVTVTGTNFTGATAVSFGAVQAPSFTVLSDTSLLATAPPQAAGQVDVLVTTLTGVSASVAADHFTYTAAAVPTVTALSPTTGNSTGGTVVSVTGTGFTGASTVTFGGTPASAVTILSDTLLLATTPAVGSSSAAVQVTTPSGTSTTGFSTYFTYTLVLPAITAIGPSSGPLAGGTTVVLSGSGFSGASAVSFGSTAATSFTVNSDTSITAVSPYHVSGAPDLTVTTPSGTSSTSSADQFTYGGTAPAPTVTGVSPGTGWSGGGVSLTLSGSNFAGATAVSFGGTAAMFFTVVSDTQLTVSAPSHTAGTVDVTVTTPNGTSATGAADQFTFVDGPMASIANWSPTTGTTAGGTVVTFNGSFTGVTSVQFGTVSVSFSIGFMGFQLTATAPPEPAGSVSIFMAAPAGPVGTTNPFTYTTGPTPTLTSLSTSSGTSAGGTAVTITGTNFTGATGVFFGSYPASYTVTSATSITATSPPQAAGTGDVTVSTFSATSAVVAADRFATSAASAPAVTGLSPATGSTAGGTTVTVSGSGFTGATGVFFGGVPAASFTVNSATSLTATAPPQTAGVVDVIVSSYSGTSPGVSADHYTYTAATAPAVTGVSPSTGSSAGGTVVTVTGTGFTGASAVTFGSVAGSGLTVNSDTSLTVTAPPQAAATVDVSVTTPSGTSAAVTADHYTSTAAAAPAVTALTPASGPGTGGTVVTVRGSGFTGTSAVAFGSTAAAFFTVISDTALLAVAPPEAAATVDLRVTTPSGQSPAVTADHFTYTTVSVPTVSGLSASSAGSGGGSLITVSGSGFTDASRVLFGSIPASSFTVYSDTLLSATVPPQAAGTWDVSVTTAAGTSAAASTDRFTATAASAPALSTLSPTSGSTAGGTPVTITGSHFTGASSMRFGTTPASSFTVLSDTSVLATAPPLPAGTVDVTLVTPTGSSVVAAADHFTVTAAAVPTVTALTPTTGSTSGGTVVTVTGTNFTGATGVTFGTTSASAFTVVSDTSLLATAPPQAAGMIDLKVTTFAGTSAVVAADHFTYSAAAAPVVTALTPTAGSTDGSTVVTILGSGFTGASAVNFGSTAASSFTVVSDSAITVNAPPQNTAILDVTVTTPSGTSALVGADQFTYLPPPLRSLPGFLTSSLAANDNGSTAAVSLGFTANFFGTNYTSVYVNNNGNVTLDGTLATATPFNLTTTIRAIIAPFFADVDTRVGPVVTYGTDTVDGHAAFGVTWLGVGYNNQHQDRVDVFQLVLISRAEVAAGAFDAEFDYGTVQWETGDASGGSGGRGGTSARIGLSNGSGTSGTNIELSGSGVNGAFLDSNFNTGLLYGSRNSNGVLGRYRFTVRAGGSPLAPLLVSSRPTVTGLKPAQGPTAGGTVVTMTGTNLAGVKQVFFGLTEASSFTVVSGTQLTVLAPPHALGTVEVRVVTATANSAAGSADQFTYRGGRSVSTASGALSLPAGPGSGPTPAGMASGSPPAGLAGVSVRRPPSNTLAFTCRLAATQGAA